MEAFVPALFPWSFKRQQVLKLVLVFTVDPQSTALLRHQTDEVFTYYVTLPSHTRRNLSADLQSQLCSCERSMPRYRNTPPDHMSLVNMVVGIFHPV